MMSLGQAYPQHPGQHQHPGVPQGHPMAGVPHNPGQQGQPGPGMPQQMHMGVSGPSGPQVSQAGAVMGGMPPGAGGPNAHAMQHLNPQQAQIYQQQQQAMFGNPQLQMQQQQMIQRQRQQQMMAQHQYGIPMGIPNGMGGQVNAAQFAAMRGNPVARPINLPQHLAQAQQQAQHNLNIEQQHAQAQAQAQHQHRLIAQQMAMNHANAQGQESNNPGQQGQMGPQQIQNMQQAQIAHHQQQQQQQAAQQNQNNPAQSQGQPQPQQPQQNPQSQGQTQQQIQQGQQPSGLQQQQATAAAMLQRPQQQQQQQQQGDRFKGQCLMKLMQFGDHLSNFGSASRPLEQYMAGGAPKLAAQGMKQRDDLNYWVNFVNQFFSRNGVLRHSVWIVDETSNKQYEITFPALARYFHTHFESGIKNMQMIMEKGSEKELPHNGHYVESPKSSFVYWFDNGSQLIANGTLRAHFDAEQKIELLDFVTSGHEEYIPRKLVLNAARPLHEWQKEWHKVNAPPDGKPSPEMNKKKAKNMKSPPQPPPQIDLPNSPVKHNMGITPSVFQFLEFAEVMGQMTPLFSYSHLNPTLAPYSSLNQYVNQIVANNDNAGGQQQNPSGPRTPGLPNFPLGQSPAAAHLQLPDGSPRIGGSPAQAPGMQLQHSQHGTSSSGPSANTSPNQSNKRRRPSAVKEEGDNQVNGTQTKATVKPSPRIGGKRQKGNPV